MQRIDITDNLKNIIRFGLAGVIVLASIIGYAEYKYWHKDEVIELDNAKVAGTMVSVRVLANGKVKELLFDDGAEVKAGDVIARLEVAITEEEIQQLENTVQLAKDNYAELAAGQWVKVPVQRERVITPPPSSYSGSSGNLAKLEERANRMAELFEMGAVSAVQRDAARRAYESALAESQSPSYSEPTVEYYTEYVDEFRATPAEVLAGADQAIKQAELSLNAAKQEARENNVIAPVSGTIYYGVEVDNEIVAGDSISRIGDSRELWLEVEVTEEIFNKIPLGKLATYTIDGKELSGTVIEKIKPNVTEKVEEAPEPIELPEIPTTENAPAQLIGDGQAAETQPAETQPTETSPAETPAEPPQAVQAETQVVENPDTNSKIKAIVDKYRKNKTPAPPTIPKEFSEQQKPNDKFIIKISIPAERDFELRPNTKTTVKIKI